MNRRERLKRLNDIASVSAALREDLDAAPDLTGRILSRVHEERPFLDRAARRWVIASRLLACGVVVGAGLFVALASRWAPDALEFEPVNRPVSAVVTDLTATTDQLVAVPKAFEEMLSIGNPGLTMDRSISTRDLPPRDATSSLVGGSGELTVRCFVGPMAEPVVQLARSAPTPSKVAAPPVTLARASTPDVPVRSLSMTGSERGWFAPVPLRSAQASVRSASFDSTSSRDAMERGRSVWPASPFETDALMPR